MRSKSSKGSKKRSRQSSPSRPQATSKASSSSGLEESGPASLSSTRSTPTVSFSERNYLTTEDLIHELESLQISPNNSPSSSPFDLSNPRSFPHSVKQQCWEKTDKVKGRDPDRWRRDPLGNIVFRKFVGCPGCLCHDYDHIVPYSKGGKSTLENCQVLQATANRSKGNRTDISRADLIQRSSYCRVSGRDMDLIELSAYGNVRHTDDPGCRIQ